MLLYAWSQFDPYGAIDCTVSLELLELELVSQFLGSWKGGQHEIPRKLKAGSKAQRIKVWQNCIISD